MLIRKYASKMSGFTFVELIVALVVNVILLAALLGVIAANANHYNRVINADTLNQQMQIAMDYMVNDIRRAGYWANASNDISTGQNNNPFMATATDINVSGGNCILFTYDHAKNGVLPSIAAGSDDDRYGFRLNGNVLQTRPPGATYACTAAATNWENITNSSVIKITALSFTLSTVSVPATAPNMALRSVNISMTGQLVTDSTITKTLTAHVRIRNDKFIP